MDQVQPNHQIGSQGKKLSTETCHEEEAFKCRAVAKDLNIRMQMAFSKDDCMP